MARPQIEDSEEYREPLHSIDQDVAEDAAFDLPVGEEYHTSSNEGSDDDENGEDSELMPSAPLLPAEVLKPHPSPVQSFEEVPWDRLTRKQKVNRRNKIRQAKKHALVELRESTKGTAVLEAGRAAQLRRGVVEGRERVRSGRIGKRGRDESKTKVSGRQVLVEQRKRLAAQNNAMVIMPSKKKSKGTANDKR